MVGRPQSNSEQAEVSSYAWRAKYYFSKLETLSQMEEENAIHQDIVQGDFDDTYK